MNTAKPKNWSATPTWASWTTFRQGAGMVDIVAAVQSEQFVSPARSAPAKARPVPRCRS
ncbi:MAG: hypothetical protein U1F49_07765 [Rubrivivax sp.]